MSSVLVYARFQNREEKMEKEGADLERSKEGESSRWGIALAAVVAVAIITVAGVSFGNIGTNLSDVSGSESILEKARKNGEWFADNAGKIKEMDERIAILQKKKEDMRNSLLAEQGSDGNNGGLLSNFEKKRAILVARDNLHSAVFQRNELVREYNEKSAEFNWRLYPNGKQKPQEIFAECPVR
jgi:hypothetical protein